MQSNFIDTDEQMHYFFVEANVYLYYWSDFYIWVLGVVLDYQLIDYGMYFNMKVAGLILELRETRFTRSNQKYQKS